MLNRSFQPGFRIDLHHKDLGIVTAAAREAGVVVPLGAVVAQLMASARANGDGGLDHSAMLRGVLRLSGKNPDENPHGGLTTQQQRLSGKSSHSAVIASRNVSRMTIRSAIFCSTSSSFTPTLECNPASGRPR